MPVQLHRPARYLNPGVPDNERALARRGTTLVGTVKSAALVEIIGERRLVVRMGWRRAAVRAARDRARRRPVECAVGRHRDGHRHRRSRRVGRRGAAATAGGGDVSRHRDLGREYRHPRRLAARRVPSCRVPGARRDARRHRRAHRVRRSRGWRRIGRSRDADGGRVTSPAVRSISAARR